MKSILYLCLHQIWCCASVWFIHLRIQYSITDLRKWFRVHIRNWINGHWRIPWHKWIGLLLGKTSVFGLILGFAFKSVVNTIGWWFWSDVYPSSSICCEVKYRGLSGSSMSLLLDVCTSFLSTKSISGDSSLFICF